MVINSAVRYDTDDTPKCEVYSKPFCAWFAVLLRIEQLNRYKNGNYKARILACEEYIIHTLNTGTVKDISLSFSESDRLVCQHNSPAHNLAAIDGSSHRVRALESCFHQKLQQR